MVSAMTPFRARSFTSTVAMFAVLILTGARAVHSEPTVFDHSVTKTATVTPGPCWLCDSPDCAIVTSAVVIDPPRAYNGTVAIGQEQVHASAEEIPLHVRPPPAI